MKAFTRAQNAGFILPNLSEDFKYFPNTKCKILDGKALSQNFITQAQLLRNNRKVPCLAVLLIGDNPASKVYVNNKIKSLRNRVFYLRPFLSESETSEAQIIKLINELNQNTNIDGILVQLPCPEIQF